MINSSDRMSEYRFTVDAEQENERLDKYLSSLLSECSRNYIQKLIKEGAVSVNEKPVKASFLLHMEDEVSIIVPQPVLPEIVPQPIPLDIIYEDDDFIIINKPKNMVVHPAAGHFDKTLVNALMYHCGDHLSGINGVMRPGIVHRIDKDTTGLLVVCKNDASHRDIAMQLKEHSIQRTYHAIVNGVLKEDAGTIDQPIGRHPTERKKMCVNHKNGKTAVTHYQVLERFSQYTYIECHLETGRTHQIRVHMASIGHPLLGDELYGGKSNRFHTDGQTLHAKTLGFIHPSEKVPVMFDSPLPEYFEKILKTLRDKKS